MRMERRRFLRLAVAALLAGATTKARASRPSGSARAGTPKPLQTLTVRGYRGLAELPYFELDGRGMLRLAIDLPAETIDFHTHLAFNMFLSPHVDLLRRTPRTEYLIDCDATHPPCELDLDVYMNRIADEEMLHRMERIILSMLVLGSDAAATYTIPNLLAEMDALGVRRSVLLPIASGLPWRDDPTDWWADSVARSGAAERFVVFGSVHPTSRSAAEDLRALAARGIRGVKLHPTMQRFYPDDPRAMELYQVCQELNLLVFFHAGRAGIEPEFTRKYAVMTHYVAPVHEYPNVRFVFGHSGARDHDQAIAIARKRPNVWMDVQGQGVTVLRQMLRELGPERLVFGSDWPFYPVAASLAKVLIATEGDDKARSLVLAETARRLLAAAGATAPVLT